MKMLIMGAPGSGKGTQSEILVEKLGIPTISTGAMLRAAIAEGTEVGKEASKYINDGKLVPDSVMIDLVLDRVSKDDCKDGYILDGFPRTLAQAQAMTEANIDIDCALVIDVADEDIIACEQCDGELVIRADDAPETVVSRLETYHNMTAPVIDYYDKMGKLVAVKAVEGVEETTELVLKALGK